MARLIDRLFSPVGQKNSIDAAFLRNVQTGLEADNGVMDKPYSKSALCYICISTTSRAISQIPIIVTKQVNSKTEERKPVSSDSPWQRLFNRPNTTLDRYSFSEALVSYLMLDGDVFVIPYPMGLNVPDALYVVRKRYMKPKKDPSTNQLVGWYYDINGSNTGSDASIPSKDSIELSLDEVSHSYFFNPDDPVLGIAPLDAARNDILIDYKASVYNMGFFDKGAVPGGVFYTDKRLGKTQFERTREQLRDRHEGYRKSHLFALLEDGLKYQQTGLSQKDMEFGDLKNLSAKRILQSFGMKATVISENDSTNLAEAREERKEWWVGTNMPIMGLIASALNFTLFKDDVTLRCQYDYSVIAAIREALKDIVEPAYRMWQMGFTANEIDKRLGLGFGYQPWRDYWYAPLNLIPVNGVPVIPTPGNTPKPPADQDPNALDQNSFKRIDLKEDSPFGEREPQLEQMWKGLAVRTDALESQFEKKVSRVIFQMRKKTLAQLFKGQKDIRDVDEELYSSEMALLEKWTGPLYAAAIEAGLESTNFPIYITYKTL